MRTLAEFLALAQTISGPFSEPFHMPKGINKKRFEDCPVCGAKHKTLYYNNGHWRCLECAKAEAAKEGMEK